MFSKDIPDIGHRIEPLLRLKIQFPSTCRQFPAGVFREQNLDLSKKEVSNTLSITLSSLEAKGVQKPAHLTSQKHVAMNALIVNDVHHPVILKSLFPVLLSKNYSVTSFLTLLNVDICVILVSSLFISDRASPASYSMTLADTAAECFPEEVLDNLLSFFETFDSYEQSMERHPRLLLAIMRLMISKPNFIYLHPSQRRFFHSDSTISKYRLLIFTIYAISRGLHDPDNALLPFCHRGVFEAILSCITSDLFIGTSTRSQNGSEYGTLVWTCRAHALACIAWFIERRSDFGVFVPLAKWATRPLFYNLLRVVAQSDEYDQDDAQLLPHQRFGSLFGVISFLFGQGLFRGICHAYEPFQQERSLEYIAQRNSLHTWFIEALQGYITFISEATDQSVSWNHRGIEPEALQSHIEDLHQVSVILANCMSIAFKDAPGCPILSALASISPEHPKWNTLLDIINWHIDIDTFLESYYSDSREVIPPGDAKCLKKNLNEILEVLTDCVETAKAHNSGIYRVGGWY